MFDNLGDTATAYIVIAMIIAVATISTNLINARREIAGKQHTRLMGEFEGYQQVLQRQDEANVRLRTRLDAIDERIGKIERMMREVG